MVHISLPYRLYLTYLGKGRLTIKDIKDAIIEDLFIIK